MYDVIEKKREGGSLTSKEIEFVIKGYTQSKIPDYQVSALLMAIYFQGMTVEESAALTMAMVASGDTVDLSMINGIKVDKHSTGGVGDTTTLILAPLVASTGVSVAKMSGRGLGHTGGTIDKLTSISGFHVEITTEQFVHLVNEYHVAVIGQSEKLVPADKLLYSLRDVTATVSSIPLIASSIMSKKIASGADAIVLDVKTGSGAFMKKQSDAIELAETMVAIGKRVGRKTTAIISNMDQPLGLAVGNALEMKEAISTLKGEGPADLTELTLTLGAHMLVLAGKTATIEDARYLLEENIQNGKAISTFKTFIENQGGNAHVVDDPSLLPQAKYSIPIVAKKSGYIRSITADEIGRAATILGAGRQTKEDVIDLAVGIQLHKKIGDRVDKGTSLCTIHASREEVEQVRTIVQNSMIIADEYEENPLILQTIDHH